MQLIISKVDNVLQKRSSLPPNLEEKGVFYFQKKAWEASEIARKVSYFGKITQISPNEEEEETERLGFEEEKEELLMGIFVI